MSRFQEYIERQNILEEQEYQEYCNFINDYSINMNENILKNISGALKKKLDFIKNMALDLGVDFIEFAMIFKDTKVFKFFARIGWSIKKLYDLLQKGLKYVHIIINAISEYIAKTPVGRWTEEKLKDLDKWLQTHPKTKRIAGIAVAAILAYIWFNMTFTGDISYDFGMDDLLLALAGKMSIASIFSGPGGVKLLLMFATGAVGLTFPWPGPAKIQFVAGIISTLIQRLKIRTKIRLADLQKSR